MSHSDRNPSQKAKHLADIARLYLQGQSQSAIAVQLKIDQSTVSRDLKELRSFWRESAIRDFDSHKAEQLAKIDVLEATYWEAWMRSLTTRETLTNESGESDAKGAFTKTITRRDVMLGNPAYLAGVERCIAERCKLLGLYAPIKTEVNAEVKEAGLSQETIDVIKSKILGISLASLPESIENEVVAV